MKSTRYPGAESCIYEHMVYDKGRSTEQCRRIIFPIEDTETTWCPYEKKQNLTPPHIKSNYRQIIDLNGIG